MKNKVVFVTLVLLFLIIGASNSIATSNYSGGNIKQNYYSGDFISGSIQVNLQNESYDSVISSNLNGKITLRELLSKNGLKSGVDYVCSNSECSTQYSLGNLVNIAAVYSSQSSLVGFKLASGNDIKIQNVNLDVSGTAIPACRNQIGVDLFDQPQHVLQNTKFTNVTCAQRYTGCYDDTLPDSSYSLANLSSIGYCIKQKLPAAPAYQLGAKLIAPAVAPNEKIFMDIYPSDFSTTPLGECILPNATQSVQEVSCITDYGGITEQEYYICVSSDKPSSAYLIRTEHSGQVCGAKTPDPAGVSFDFNIFAQPLGYDSPSFTLDNDLFNLVYFRENFTNVAQDYLQQKYAGDCNNNACIIPLAIHGDDQSVSLFNPSLTYTSAGIQLSENNLYDVKKESAKISSNNIILNLLPAQFAIPYGTQPTNFILYINNKTIINTPINVTKGVAFDIQPRFALIGVPVQFSIQSQENISNASWTFSDSAVVSNGLSVVHKFASQGEYNVMVQITTREGKTSSRTLKIAVGEAQASANDLLSISRQRIANLEGNLSSLPIWVQSSIRTKLNVSLLNSSLENIATKLAFASNDTEFITSINNIESLDIPSSLAYTRQGTYPLALLYTHTDFSAISKISGKDNYSSASLQPDLINWLNDNYDAQINLKVVSSQTYGSAQDLATLVQLTLTPKPNIGATGNQYLIINYPAAAIQFKEQYGQKAIDSSTYIPIKFESKVVEFMIPDGIESDSLGMYLSPDLNQLGVSSEVITPVADNSRTQTLTIIIGLISVLVLVCVIAFVLQYWYKRRYESYLFKKGEDLYNVMTFVYNSRNSGLKEEDIKKKLSSSGWSREQIGYAFDKLSGKVLGIFGIPIFRASQEKDIKDEIQRRQQGGDIRFIKR